MDIFDQLKAIDRLDIDAIEDEEFEKKFSPYMALKWYAAVKDPLRIKLVNSIANPMIFQLHKEKKLLYYLLCCCSDGSEKRYSWIKRPKKTNINLLNMVSEYYQISGREAEMTIKELNNDDLLEILDLMDYDDKLRNKIKKSL